MSSTREPPEESRSNRANDSPHPPECLSCGTCCFSTLERYVPVSGDDYERLGDDAEALTRFIGNRAYMRMVDGHCIALRVDADRAELVCTIYERRPSTCRELERGSAECWGERSTKAERPLIALSRARGGKPHG